MVTSINCTRRRFLKPMKQSAIASVAPPGNSGLEFWRRALTDDGAETVSVEVAAVVPDGVTVAGEKLQDAPEGNPEQLKVVAEAKPFCGATEIMAVPLCPGAMVSDDGDTVTEKFGAGMLMV